MTVQVVTDASASLPQDVVDELGIDVIDLHVMAGQGKDGTERSTSGLSALELAAAYGRAMERSRRDGQDDGVVAIHLSKVLSSTYSQAVNASGVFDEDKIRVIDSESAGMVMGAAAMAAARLALDGADVQECFEAAQDTLRRAKTWAYIQSIDALRKSGRMSATTAMLSTALLATKPIMSITDGKLELVGKTRTQTKAFSKLVELVAERADGEPAFVAIQHCNAPEPAELLRELLEQALPEGTSFITCPLNEVIAVHAGPGAIAVSVVFSSEAPEPTPANQRR
ncbi:DegV family protein [Corynebacterium endometrii]|uniref:DegV domain-containing protein n=1 Tax=Corynebacterium endometrii TaxID=2488819 RepID=A0A4P7QJ97_9CORY|nr:DegV family protein [Corynebacterium endometrii]QCB29004.1 DegV domain-containing protein [Corynebacterium endometrii]